MINKRKKGIIVFFIFVTTLFVACSSNEVKEDIKDEKLFLIEQGTNMLSNGKIQSKESEVINVKSLENVTDMNFKTGDKVSVGDILYKIEDKSAKGKVQEAQNELSKNLTKASSLKEQIDSLYAQIDDLVNKLNSISEDNELYTTLKNEYNRMNSEYSILKKEYDSKNQLISDLYQDINHYSQKQFEMVYASINGIYTYSIANNQIIINSEDLVVLTQVKEYDYDKINIGDILTIKDIYRNQYLQGAVINKSEVPSERYTNVSEYKLIIDIPDDYINGTSVEIFYNNNYIDVPNTAVEEREDGYYINVVEEGKKSSIKVNGEFKEDVFKITSGIEDILNKEIVLYYNEDK